MPDLGWGGLIAGGSTAGLDWNQQTNPYPHPLLRGGNPRFAPLRMGYMLAISQPSPDAPWGIPPNYYSLRFHYNPSAISASMQFNPSVLNPIYQAGGASPAQGLLTGMYMTWDMLFDRTYELAGIGTDTTNGYGCLVDYAAFYNLLGALDPGSPNIPVTVPVQVVFGKTPAGKKWGFTGYLTQADMNFLTFNKNMIPQRMTINCTLQTTFIPSNMGGAPSTGADPTTGQPLPQTLPGSRGLVGAGPS